LIDAIHDLPDREELAPAQLYSTESGRLFHSGRIVIATVGLPARGKTHISVALARYLRWLGVKTRIFHLGDYRRAEVGHGKDVPDDYFFVNASPTSVLLRQKVLKKCREDIYHFLEHENGQIAIYDAVNPLSAGRRALAKEFAKHRVQTLFIESTCTDERIIEENVRSVKISSPDYIGWDDDAAIKDYLSRINARIPHFETMEEPELHFIKMINAGERVTVNNGAFGYLSQRIVFYLLNLHIKSRQTYFARAGTTTEESSYKADASLSAEGEDYAGKMTETLIRHREQERQAQIARGGSADALKPLSVWTSTRRRTIETSRVFFDKGYSVRQRSQMSQLNPGVCEKMSERRIRETYPHEVRKHEADPYHHRYPRAEVCFSGALQLIHTSTSAYSAGSLTTTLPSASSPSSSSSSANRTTYSSSPTSPSSASSTATSWPATPSTSPTWSSHEMKSSKCVPHSDPIPRRALAPGFFDPLADPAGLLPQHLQAHTHSRPAAASAAGIARGHPDARTAQRLDDPGARPRHASNGKHARRGVAEHHAQGRHAARLVAIRVASARQAESAQHLSGWRDDPPTSAALYWHQQEDQHQPVLVIERGGVNTLIRR